MATKKLVMIVGPTAVGKTAFAIEVAKKLGTEIVSCDSRQCYRELRIGVARPSTEELESVRHHFIANRSVSEPYNVFTYEQEAIACINRLFENHDNVVAVGGSGLYAQALCQGIAHLPDPDPALRAKLQTLPLKELQAILREKDPVYFETVDKQNPIRLQRALEVISMTGEPYSAVIRQKPALRPFEIEKIGLYCQPNTLRERINCRTDTMFGEGIVEEALGLLPLRNLQPLNTVGYKELFAMFDGICSKEEAISSIKTHTWQYAKKQLSFFKRDSCIFWKEK